MRLSHIGSDLFDLVALGAHATSVGAAEEAATGGARRTRTRGRGWCMPADAQHLLRVVHDVLLASRNGPGDAYGVIAQGLELLQRHVGVPGGLKGVDPTEGNRRLQDHAVPVRLVARELRSRGKVDATPSHPTIPWLHLLRLEDDFGGRNICLVVELRAP